MVKKLHPVKLQLSTANSMIKSPIMNKPVYIILILFLAAVPSLSQKLYFCEEYTDGKEIGVSDVFIISENGGFFTCMLDLRGTGNTVGTDKVNLKIEKVDGSSSKYPATEKFDVQSDWDYIFFDKYHTFYEAGKYKVTALKPDDTPIASGEVTIEVKADIVNSSAAKLYFCSKYENNEIGVSDVFYVSIIEGGTFTAMLDLRGAGTKMGTDKITLRINKLSGVNETFVANEKFDVQADWDYIYFSDFHNFKSAGTYRITALKPDGSEIATGDVSIRNR